MNYKVVKIVNEYLVVINYGKKHNAKIGDILEIFQVGELVFDPDSDELLGTLDITKGRIKVKNVYENMSLCESNEFVTTKSPALVSFGQTLSYLSNNLSKTELKALNVNSTQVTGGYDEDDKGLINISDPVKIIKSAYLDNLEEEEDNIDAEFEDEEHDDNVKGLPGTT